LIWALLALTAEQTKALIVVAVLGAVFIPLALFVVRRVDSRERSRQARDKAARDSLPDEYLPRGRSVLEKLAFVAVIVVAVIAWLRVGAIAIILPIVMGLISGWRTNELANDAFEFVEQDFPSFVARHSHEEVETALQGLKQIYGERRVEQLRMYAPN
jgi:fructose-specific phosphotransferase system IIC component